MDNNMPSMADLSTIFGSYSPEMYMQGRQQIGQSNQMQEQAIQKASLANMFSAQQNPQLLEKQRLDNEGSGLDNVVKGVNSRHAVATEGFKLADEQRKQALAAPEHEIKMMAAQAQQMAYSPDPAIQAKGQKLMAMSEAAIQARAKHAQEMEKQEMIRKSAEKVAAGNNSTQLQVANISAAARKGAGGGKAGSIQDLVRTGKLSAEKAAVAFASEANMTDDPEEKMNLMRQAQVYEQMAMQLRAAQSQGKIDAPGVTGLPAMNLPPALGAQAPAAAPANPAGKPPPPAVGAVSKGHVFLGGDPANPQSWKKQ